MWLYGWYVCVVCMCGVCCCMWCLQHHMNFKFWNTARVSSSRTLQGEGGREGARTRERRREEERHNWEQTPPSHILPQNSMYHLNSNAGYILTFYPPSPCPSLASSSPSLVRPVRLPRRRLLILSPSSSPCYPRNCASIINPRNCASDINE